MGWLVAEKNPRPENQHLRQTGSLVIGGFNPQQVSSIHMSGQQLATGNFVGAGVVRPWWPMLVALAVVDIGCFVDVILVPQILQILVPT